MTALLPYPFEKQLIGHHDDVFFCGEVMSIREYKYNKINGYIVNSRCTSLDEKNFFIDLFVNVENIKLGEIKPGVFIQGVFWLQGSISPNLILKEILEGDIDKMYKYWESAFFNKLNLPIETLEMNHIDKMVSRYFKKELDFKTLCDWEWMVLFSDSFEINQKEEKKIKKLLWLIEDMSTWGIHKTNINEIRKILKIKEEFVFEKQSLDKGGLNTASVIKTKVKPVPKDNSIIAKFKRAMKDKYPGLEI